MRQIIGRGIWGAASSLCLLAMGCSGADPVAAVPDFGMEVIRDVGVTPGCMSDESCGPGRVCSNGNCTLGECNLDRTCPAGQTCNQANFTCSGSNNENCTEDTDCSGRAICNSGNCVEVQCRNSDDCNPNETCNAQNRCVAMVADCVDSDGDGYGQGCADGPDCDDRNPDVNPVATENGTTNCDDGIDNNCDGGDARCGANDNDSDGYTDLDGDCDDGDADVNPGQSEVPYNGKDDDCDPRTRDRDVDGDGYEGREVGGDDCDDRAAHINPEARDIPGDNIDQNCDGADAEPTGDDADGDGVSEADGDCNDNDPGVNPSATEVPYNGVDDDCNVATRDNDLDGDGFESPVDCDDDKAAVNPNAREVHYNGTDDDCNPETRDGDADNDGFLALQVGGVDCNDDAATINPEAAEVPYNGADDDCNPNTRDDDLDEDGVNRATDCDDNNPAINPNVIENATTLCSDGIDHDCRGGDVTCEANASDRDMDGVPDGQDCAPDNAAIPGPVEIPNNGLDDDCNPATPDVVAVCADDQFDNGAGNDGQGTASGVEDGNTLALGQYTGLIICGADEDWYRIDLRAGDGLEADVAFDAEEGDIDVRLLKSTGEGAPVLVDTSAGITDTEVVYERRAAVNATYYVVVHRFLGSEGRSGYTMSINVFSQCTDDTASRLSSRTGEHNDTQLEAVNFPAAGETRQICDYDDDYYTFTLAARQNVRLDLLFSNAAGDIDLQLFRRGVAAPVASSRSVTDDEIIEMQLDAGTYVVRVFGFLGSRNSYRLFRTSGAQNTARLSMPGADVAIPDYANGAPGVARVELNFNAPPAGSVIRSLRIRDLDINHSFLRDLKVTALWNDEPVAVLWNREGDLDGGDGGLDDDFLPFTGGDINFDDRDYPQFAGRAARGRFTLLVEDMAITDTGVIADLDVEITYLAP